MRIWIVAAATWLIACVAQAQYSVSYAPIPGWMIPGTGPGSCAANVLGNGNGAGKAVGRANAPGQLAGGACSGIPGGGTGGPTACAAGNAYIAALSAMDATHINAYGNMICTFVSTSSGGAGNNLWQWFDWFYIYANTNHANAVVNAKNPGTFNAVENGTCTFTPDRGIQGNGSTCYHNTGFNPSTAGGQYSLNHAIIGACVLNNRTTDPGNNPITVGAQASPGSTSVVEALFSLAGGSGEVVNTGAGGSNNTVTTSRGHIQAYRNSSAADTLFVNGVNLRDNFQVSSSTTNSNFYVFNMSVNNAPGTFWSPDQVAVAYAGGADPADDPIHNNPAVIRNIILTMLNALSVPAGC